MSQLGTDMKWLVILILIIPSLAFGASCPNPLYVDYVGGHDAATGANATADASTGALQRSPGDANCGSSAGVGCNCTPVTDQVVNFKGGVKYKGKIDFGYSGTTGHPITFQGNPVGWGTGKAVIDGTASVSMTQCSGNGVGAGQVPNANYANIYYGTLPPGIWWDGIVFENGTALTLSQWSGNPIPFFFDDTVYWKTSTGNVGRTSTVDSTNLSQADSNYYAGGAIILRTISGNDRASSVITSYNSGTHTVTYGDIGQAVGADTYNIVGSPGQLSGSGQYAIDSIRGLIFVWPNSPPASNISVSSQYYGFHTNGQSYATIDGFTILGQYQPGTYSFLPSWQSSHSYSLGDMVRSSTYNGYAFKCTQAGTSGGSEPSWTTVVGYTTNDGGAVWICISNFTGGRAITGSSSSPTDGVIIKNCDIKYISSGGSSGITYLNGNGTAQNVIQDSTISYIDGRGPFVTGNNVAVKNNSITYTTGTGIYTQNTGAIPNQNGEFSGNTLNYNRGIHSNGITVYGSDSAMATNWVIKNNIILNYTHPYGSGCVTAQGFKNLLIYNNVCTSDYGMPIDGGATANNGYFRFYNNIIQPANYLPQGGPITGTLRIFGLANNAVNDFKNNITNGLIVSDGDSGVPVTATVWSHITHTNNIYTGLASDQDSGHGWTMDGTEKNSSASSLFVNAATDNYTTKAASVGIDAGTSLATYFTTDILGSTRSGTWDIGPYEYGGGSPPATSTITGSFTGSVR